MLGGMFGGHDECAGEIIEDQNKKYKIVYGMSSTSAMHKHHGGMASHRTSEGKIVKVPYKGPVEDTVLDILGSLRSTCTYIGARRLKDMPKCATFIRVNNQLNNAFSGKEFQI
jgi:GMP reductase